MPRDFIETYVIGITTILVAYSLYYFMEDYKSSLNPKRCSKKKFGACQNKCKKKKTQSENGLLPCTSEDWDPNEELQFTAKNANSSGLLILIRHGQSVWNRKPKDPDALWRYAGSLDIPLSAVGIDEALEAGDKLQNIPIDLIFCSQMDRARTTVSLAMSVHTSRRTPIIQNLSPLQEPSYKGVNDTSPQDFIVPVYITSALNERNFGDLQGVASPNHRVVLAGQQSIRQIRNDFYTPFPGKNGESSADVYDRTIPCLEKFILPHLKAGRNVLVSSHGFAIRTMIKYLDRMSDKEWNQQMSIEKSHPEDCKLLAPTGVPLTYCYKNGRFVKMRQSRRDRTESLTRSSAAY